MYGAILGDIIGSPFDLIEEIKQSILNYLVEDLILQMIQS